MPRTLRPSVPPSFSEVASRRSRALSVFVAIAHAQIPAPELSAFAKWTALLAGVTVVFALGLSGVLRVEVLAMACTVLLGSLAWWWKRERAVWTFGTPAEQRTAARAILLSRLDRERRSIGLDHALMPEQIVPLETAAQIWERIENTLTGPAWKAQEELKQQIERTSFSRMLDLVAFMLGDPVAEGINPMEVPEFARQAANRLQEIGRALVEATTALESYARPDESTAPVPASAAFPEVEELEELVKD